MKEVLSREEIKQRYPDEWVLVGNPETNEALEVLRGTVLHHSTDREEIYRNAIALKPNRFAVLRSGRLPESRRYIL